MHTFKKSGLYDIIKDGCFIKRTVVNIKMHQSIVTSIIPASMSGDIVSDTSATYAVVDFAMKAKKKKNVCVPEDDQE